MKLKLITILPFLLLASCFESSNQTSASGAKQVSPNEIQRNSKGLTSEQQNIQDRLKVTTQIGKILWMHLVNTEGNITKRFPVRNKTTSAGKRLEPTETIGRDLAGDNNTFPTYNGWKVNSLLMPDGTYGNSGDYQYWFDPMGRYHQIGTAGMTTYLLTDYPIDLENQVDKITGLYNVNVLAEQWAKKQESNIEK